MYIGAYPVLGDSSQREEMKPDVTLAVGKIGVHRAKEERGEGGEGREGGGERGEREEEGGGGKEEGGGGGGGGRGGRGEESGGEKEDKKEEDIFVKSLCLFDKIVIQNLP
jgi:hypothetical protein